MYHSTKKSKILKTKCMANNTMSSFLCTQICSAVKWHSHSTGRLEWHLQAGDLLSPGFCCLNW